MQIATKPAKLAQIAVVLFIPHLLPRQNSHKVIYANSTEYAMALIVQPKPQSFRLS